jgi:alpha/beta superfamily hydrolase
MAARSTTKSAQTLAKTFFALGYVAVRFNFRGVGQSKAPSTTAKAKLPMRWRRFASRRRASTRSEARCRSCLAGFSFGAFVQTKVAQAVAAQRLVLVGPAVGVSPPRPFPPTPSSSTARRTTSSRWDEVLAWARPQELPVVVFPGCGHFFHGRLLHLQRTIAGMWHDHAAAPGA